MGLLSSICGLLFGSPPQRRKGKAQPMPTPVTREAGPWVARSNTKPQVQSPTAVAAAGLIIETLRGPCYVVDGDTITIGKTNIRLAGVDAPEMDHPYGKNAKWALVKLCKGQVITAEFTEHLSYGRVVATCFLPDGRDLSAEMVKLGMAIDWRKFSGGKYRHLEPEGVRRRLWRCDARQKGQMPPKAMPN